MKNSTSFSLSEKERSDLAHVLRQRKADGLIIRRANALLLLDKGWQAAQAADALFLDTETIKQWRADFVSTGMGFVHLSAYSKRQGHLDVDEERALRSHFSTHPARSTNEIRHYIRKHFGHAYSRSGAIKLMGRLGFVYEKPKLLPLKADEQEQHYFLSKYNRLCNKLLDDEVIVFGDAVPPEYQSRPAHGWFLRGSKPVMAATSGRKRLNIHGCLNLETFQFQFVETQKINGESTRQLLQKLEAAYPSKHTIHVFLDNARYHHAKVLQPWLNAPERRVKLHFLPSYAPHLNPPSRQCFAFACRAVIERLWGVMHKQLTHNRTYEDYNTFTREILNFFRKTLPEKWPEFRDTVTDNFRVIKNENYQLIE